MIKYDQKFCLNTYAKCAEVWILGFLGGTQKNELTGFVKINPDFQEINISYPYWVPQGRF